MLATKFSRQRECIKDYLKSTTSHPTADTIYENVRKAYPKISLGTVYRNLNLLADNGEILRLSCGDSSEHFDGNPIPHQHFVCTNCHTVLDLEENSSLDIALHQLNYIANEKFHGKIDGNCTYFYGKCPKCVV